jgi:hypothetical protein
MALEFRKVAMHCTPGFPRCLRSWRGIALIPELLLALK